MMGKMTKDGHKLLTVGSVMEEWFIQPGDIVEFAIQPNLEKEPRYILNLEQYPVRLTICIVSALDKLFIDSKPLNELYVTFDLKKGTGAGLYFDLSRSSILTGYVRSITNEYGCMPGDVAKASVEIDYIRSVRTFDDFGEMPAYILGSVGTITACESIKEEDV